MIGLPQTVLFLSHDASRTGAPIFLLRLLQWLRDHRQISFRTLVVSPGELLPEFEATGPTDVLERRSRLQRVCHRLNLPFYDDSIHLRSLQESLSDSNIGLIYANTSATGKALDYLSFLGCPVICHVHELEQAIRQCDRDNNLNLVKRYATSYIAVSQAVRSNLLAKHGIAGDKVEVVHGFIPAQQCVPGEADESRAAVRRQLKIPKNARLACACGSIEPRKGPDLFLQVAGDLAKARGDLSAHFVWIGGDKEQVRTMRRQARELRCEDNVHFIGSRPDVRPYYDASDVFLLTSREDPFPLVMLEAALRGKPVVCFDNSGGAPEFVQHDAGFVVPGFAVDEMAGRLALLFGSEELRRSMGEAGRQRVLRHHDINTSAPRIVAMIQNALIPSKNIATRPQSAAALGAKLA